MKQDIIKLIGLPHLWIDKVEVKNQEVIAFVRSPRTSALCPGCTCVSEKIHQYHQRRIIHSVWQSRKVVILLTKRRFYCRHCNKPFSEYIPDIDRRRTTVNFRNILLKDLARSSLNRVRDDTNISSSVLYSALREDYKKRQKINWNEQGKNITLGIDEHSFAGRRMALTVTNITKRKLLAVAPDDRIGTVENLLSEAPKDQIAEVCIDMKAGYLNAALRQLPKAEVVVDKLHVIAYANKTLDEVRSIVVGKGWHVRKILFLGKEKLDENQKLKLKNTFEKFKNFPALYEAYFIKEKLRDFYRLPDKQKAEKELSKIIMFCECSNSRFIKDFGGTLRRWQKYILNYFNRFSTNAFTEGVHTKIKMIKRISFGFRNITNYIAKVTLAFVPLLWLIHHTI